MATEFCVVVPSIFEPSVYHPSDAYIFEVVPRFLENLCTAG